MLFGLVLQVWHPAVPLRDFIMAHTPWSRGQYITQKTIQLEYKRYGVSLRLTWHALVQLYKGYFCKALPSVAEGPAYALRGGPVFNNQPTIFQDNDQV